MVPMNVGAPSFSIQAYAQAKGRWLVIIYDP
jgi:hypothetical protein